MKNYYAKKVQDGRRAMLNRGMIVGQQWAIDLMCICLHRLGWGYDRVKRLLDKRYPDVKTLGYDRLPRRYATE